MNLRRVSVYRPRRLRAFGAAVLVSLFSAYVAAQPPEAETFREHHYKLQHQPVSEALRFIQDLGLLSPESKVSVGLASNTLVVFDRASSVRKIVDLLEEFDHPPLRLEIEIMILRASRAMTTASGNPLSPAPDVVTKLRGTLRYNEYAILASETLTSQEGHDVTYQVGHEFLVRFKIGTITPKKHVAEKELRLSAFQIERRSRSLIDELEHNVTVTLGEPTAYAFARDPSADNALVVALTFRSIEAEK